MRMKIADFLTLILPIRRIRFQEAPDLLEVPSPTCAVLLSLPHTLRGVAFPVWES